MRLVLLDLEMTVIDDWYSRNALHHNIIKIRSYLEPDDALGLMSWAVLNSEDKMEFVAEIQPGLERLLQRPFNEEFVLSMHDISDIILKRRRKWVSKDDMYDLFGKEECLLQFLRMKVFPPFKEIVLIDDCVSHLLEFTLNSQAVRFINIDSL